MTTATQQKKECCILFSGFPSNGSYPEVCFQIQEQFLTVLNIALGTLHLWLRDARILPSANVKSSPLQETQLNSNCMK